jgi:tetratricopeptide (TPR) repeat protein
MAEKCLLVLDGLEPLQHPTSVKGGELKDRGMARFLKVLGQQLETQWPGLCIVTSRQPLVEVANTAQVLHWPLDRLSEEAGSQLLLNLGVRGLKKDLRKSVAELEGHALSVTLLGTYLSAVEGGDIRQRSKFNFGLLTDKPEEWHGDDTTSRLAKRAKRILEGYIDRLRDMQSASGGGVELALLNVVGLFDRVADGGAVKALLQEPPIPGVTEGLFLDPKDGAPLSTQQRAQRLRVALDRLRRLNLLAPAGAVDPDGIDAHPIIRAAMAQRLIESNPAGYKAGHERLFRHYEALIGPNSSDYEIWAYSINHGVLSGRVGDSWNLLYGKRDKTRLASQLRNAGSHSILLGLLSHFTSGGWLAPRADLSEGAQLNVLKLSANCMMALGRLEEAAEIFDAINTKTDEESTTLANLANLSEAYYVLGDIPRALAIAEKARDAAEGTAHIARRISVRFRLAHLYFQTNRAEDLNQILKSIEHLVSTTGGALSRLTHTDVFRYCDMLSSTGLEQYAIAICRQLIDSGSLLSSTLSGAVFSLALAQAGGRDALRREEGASPREPSRTPQLSPLSITETGLLRHFAIQPVKADFRVREAFDTAIFKLRNANSESYLAQGLIERARHHRWLNEPGDADAARRTWQRHRELRLSAT